MRKLIEFWFDFSSPYAYFAAEAIEPFAADLDHDVVWRPFLLGAVFAQTNMTPLVGTPLRGAYAQHDWDRIARMMSVPFRIPDSHPYSAIKVSRAFYWIEANHPKRAKDFAQQVFRAHFAEGRDPSQASVIVKIADSVGLPGDDLLHAIQDAGVKQMLKQRTDEAIARNIFGAPFFVVDGEPFWGWDRLPLMRQWIERGGW